MGSPPVRPVFAPDPVSAGSPRAPLPYGGRTGHGFAPIAGANHSGELPQTDRAEAQQREAS